MIKGILGLRDGDPRKPVVLLGVTKRNLEKLELHQPIRVDLSELGLDPIWIVISYGDTEEAIIAEMRAAGVTVHHVVDKKTPHQNKETHDHTD